MSKSHQDRLHSGATTEKYRENYDRIFYKRESKLEKVADKHGKITYRLKK